MGRLVPLNGASPAEKACLLPLNGACPANAFCGTSGASLGTCKASSHLPAQTRRGSPMAKACALVPHFAFAGQGTFCGTEAPIPAGQGENSGPRRPICGTGLRDKNESAGQGRFCGTSPVTHARQVCARPKGAPHPLPCLNRQVTTSPPCASTTPNHAALQSSCAIRFRPKRRDVLRKWTRALPQKPQGPP